MNEDDLQPIRLKVEYTKDGRKYSINCETSISLIEFLSPLTITTAEFGSKWKSSSTGESKKRISNPLSIKRIEDLIENLSPYFFCVQIIGFFLF
jgi:hypothetical protein